MKGKLYLIPTLLGGEDTGILPEQTKAIIGQLDVYIVENVRSARRYLVKMGVKQMGKVIDDLTFLLIDKHKSEAEFTEYLKAAEEGKDIGLLSEAGCPAIADPGSAIVKAAHWKKIDVIPLIGPSSILLALMGSGMNGQQFSFHGYLPISRGSRIQKIKELEKAALKYGKTQIFIETPYRNNPMLEDILDHCKANTNLCIAVDITLPTQKISTQKIVQWKKKPPNLHKRPVVFLLGR